jgi:deltex-like protein
LGSSFKTLEHCKHNFHESCIDQWFRSTGKQSCPTCGYIYGITKGPQPPNGQMLIKYLPTSLPGYDYIPNGPHQGPTIEITYIIPSGRQGPLNPSPNESYSGTTRRAYLPNNKEGREILSLLQRAFHDQHIFTIGRSSTTGQNNVVTWNDIHHKTSIHGGPQK